MVQKRLETLAVGSGETAIKSRGVGGCVHLLHVPSAVCVVKRATARQFKTAATTDEAAATVSGAEGCAGGWRAEFLGGAGHEMGVQDYTHHVVIFNLFHRIDNIQALRSARSKFMVCSHIAIIVITGLAIVSSPAGCCGCWCER